MHTHADVKNQKPFTDGHRNVSVHRVAALHSCLQMLLYGALKEAAHYGLPDKNANENNRKPHSSNEWATRRFERSGCICRHRIWNCTLGDQASLPSASLMMRQYPKKEWGNLAQVRSGVLETPRSQNPIGNGLASGGWRKCVLHPDMLRIAPLLNT